jgi:CTP:molybdopterin cytidylyltransferase MocA
MIVAILLADQTTPIADGLPAPLLDAGGQTVIERIAGTVLRGPFGGTIVAAHPETSVKIREALHGFALQHAEIKSARGPHSILSQALNVAAQFRQRWEKIMAAAASRFDTDDDDEEDEANERPKKKSPPKPQGKADWSKHRKSPDVKVRGLARSFDRDGVMIFRADQPLVSLELQAQVVEAFAREGAAKGDAAKAFAQPVCSGQRGFPIVMDLNAAREAAALPATTEFDRWLLDQLPRVQDIGIDEVGALDRIATAADYEALKNKFPAS